MGHGAYSLGGKPTGTGGYLTGVLMNIFQTGGYISIINRNDTRLGDTLLDIGCGGGAFINTLIKKKKIKTACAIDHSERMIELAAKKNRSLISEGIVHLESALADSLPFPNERFDTVTAMETIQFWADIDRAIDEVHRVLKPQGLFLIINRYPKKESRWYQKMQLKDASAYRKLLEQHGMEVKNIYMEQKKGWIIVISQKYLESADKSGGNQAFHPAKG